MLRVRHGVLLLVCLLLLPEVSAAESFAVVASAENPARSIDAATLRRLYLKEQSEWPDGTTGKPIARPAGSRAHELFLEHVLRMDQSRLTRHWISLKQRTGQRRALQVDSDEKLILLLRRFPGAFGVLPTSAVEDDPSLTILLRIP